MQRVKFAELPPEERREHLMANCDRVTEGHSYIRELTDSEVENYERQLSKVAVELDRLETKLKDIKDEYKHEMDPLKKELKEMVSIIRTGRIEEEGTVFAFLTTDGYVETYNENGFLVGRSRALGRDRQISIANHLRDEVDAD